jgi:hypothetical protein
MLTFLMHRRTAWNDFFPGTGSNNYNSQKYSSRPTLSGTNVYVSNCLFISITSSSDGGALSCTSMSCLLIESSSFFSCKTSGQMGGAVYFENRDSGQFVLHEVCGNDCYLTSGPYGQFALTRVKYDASSKNHINYSSFARCVNENSNAHYTVCLEYGINYCPSVNSSNNKCHQGSGISVYPYGDSNSVTCSFTYSSFADNIANGYTCIYLWRSTSIFEIKGCNIIRNSQTSLSSQGTIYSSGKLTIEDSCILENEANCIFYIASSCTVALSNCTVDSTSSNRGITILNTVTKSFILALNHMSTQNCHSGYDSAGTLTPITQSSSSSKKQKLYYSCQRLFYHPPQGNFGLLISVFIFSFIHPYASGKPFVLMFLPL